MQALSETRALPAGVRGPVDLRALLRLAASLAGVMRVRDMGQETAGRLRWLMTAKWRRV